MSFTPSRVKAMMADYAMVRISLSRYRRERQDIINQGAASIVTVPSGSAAPGDPVLNKVTALDNLDARYRDILTFDRCVQDVIRWLPRKTAQAFRLHYFKGHNLRETAKKVGVSPTTIRRWLDDAIDTLTNFLNLTS